MAKKTSSTSLTAARLREVLHYDPETGAFTWRVDRRGTTKRGVTAGAVNAKGYRYIAVDGRQYLAHRLAWFYMTGEWPANQLDHNDRNPANNAWANLRQSTNGQNSRNSRGYSKVGLKGVSWNAANKKWAARIYFDGKQRLLGVYETPEQAHEAYRAASAAHFGEFACTGHRDLSA